MPETKIIIGTTQAGCSNLDCPQKAQCQRFYAGHTEEWPFKPNPTTGCCEGFIKEVKDRAA